MYIFANIAKILLWRVSRFLKNEIILKKFGNPKIISTFAIPIAEIAQLVEHDLANEFESRFPLKSEGQFPADLFSCPDLPDGTLYDAAQGLREVEH